MMVNEGETVFVVHGVIKGVVTENEAVVLGSEDQFVWLYAPMTRKIYRSNPDVVQNHDGRKVLFHYDYCKSIDHVFDKNLECDPGVFWHAHRADPARMTSLLKAYKLIEP